MTVRLVVAEDDALGRERLVRILRAEPDAHVVDVCAEGEAALTAIRERAPDVAFLDVQLPGLDAFALMEAVPVERAPVFVLVTAYDGYAIQAFEHEAADYVLKPFSRSRVHTALARARARLAARSAVNLQQVLSAVSALERRSKQQSGRIAVRDNDRTFFLKVDAIDWIEAAGKFLHVHVGKQTHTLRGTMAGALSRLDPADFVRVSRAAIVNVDRIQEIQPWFQGAHILILRDRTQITSTRRYRRNLRLLLGK
ncbi:MAG TPA: LytTR family DNA-binding domain-containing protein [Gemmatimonadales bacterium]|nr:LytTR family DNA-binding domain-containing protein [Gemmatimonadales bacterium]